MAFTRIILEQGTDQWHEWRHAGIGASEAPAILGENPWKSADMVYNEKLGPPGDNGGNQAMALGSALEPSARSNYCRAVGGTIFEPACLQHSEKSWLHASVDGITTCNQRMVEIKCGQSVYRKTAASGHPPGHYYGQLQHILAVTELSAIDFYCYWPNCRPIHLTVSRDERYIETMLKAEEEFWMSVLAGRKAIG